MQQQKQQIQNNLKAIFNLDFGKIYQSGANKQPWNNYSEIEVRNYVNNVLSILRKIHKDDSHLNNIGINFLNQLSSHTQQIINSYQNTGISNLDKDSITTHHFDILNRIEDLNVFLRNSGLYTEIEISTKEIKSANLEFESLESFLNEVVENKPVYEKALSDLQGLLNKQGEVNTATLNGQADAFKKRAEEYSTNNFKNSSLFGSILFWRWKFWGEDKSGIWWWLVGTLIFAIITGGITATFINNSSGASTGAAILRIAGIIVPSYLTVFCASQYLYGKKLYESYMFKYASLQTMNNLITTNNDLKEKILSRGLDVLFSEPNTKNHEASKEDKMIISELLNMLKGQLKG